jgi:tellurite resistance protein
MTQPSRTGSIEAEIGLCILLSAVDGEISDPELSALTDRVGELLGDDFDPMALPGLVEGELGAIEEQGIDDYVAKLPERIPAARRYEAVRAACKVACADGLAPEEEEVVRQVCDVLEVDADEVIAAVGARNDTIAAEGDAHDDEPNEQTTIIAEHLIRSGWVDPMQTLRDAGITVSGFGAVALQYQSATGHLLRVEHHTCDGTIHLHVTDEDESGSDLVLYPDGRERDLLGVITAMQEDVTLENLEENIARLLAISRVSIFKGGSLVEIERPS